MESLLKIKNLTVEFQTGGKRKIAVDHLSFQVKRGEILGIVGESGSGKSMTAHAILKLLPESALVSEGEIWFEGQELLQTDSKKQKRTMQNTKQSTMRDIRGKQISMIFQEPMTSLNPLLTVGEQIEEMLRVHEKLTASEYKDRTIEAMEDAGLEDCEELYAKYPHELSGGMRQRVMIAMAMITKPKLLIADEPTTALDVSIQEKILDLLLHLNEKYHMAIIFISHDLSVIRYLCHRALVMKQGQLVEAGEIKELFLHPKTEDTRKLIMASPSLWYGQQTVEGYSDQITDSDNSTISWMNREEGEETVILEINHVSAGYKQRKGLFSRKTFKEIVKDVTLSIPEGEIVGIVGESGSGKTTLAKAIMNLKVHYTGAIRFFKPNLLPQMVFQDPYSSLNPAKRVGWILEEPLKIHKSCSKEERRKRVAKMVSEVGLEEEHLTRYISELSGGQRQRVAIALALMLHSKFIVLDEPVSALDVTVQAQILDLLMELKDRYHLSYLFISHDLNVIHQICDRTFVMQNGVIVEHGETKELFANPKCEYTKSLLHASMLSKAV